MSEGDKKNINVDVTGLQTNEKLVYEYDDQGRLKSVSKVNRDECWVVTAYYGTPLDPNVCVVRAWRDSLMEVPFWGLIAKAINRLYKYLGKTMFAVWWKAKLNDGKTNFPRIVTKNLCGLLTFLARR